MIHFVNERLDKVFWNGARLRKGTSNVLAISQNPTHNFIPIYIDNSSTVAAKGSQSTNICPTSLEKKRQK